MKNEFNVLIYFFVIVGVFIECGGCVIIVISGLILVGLEVVCVGDVVIYDDGSEVVIIDGVGSNYSRGKLFVLVGSWLSNGDCIIEILCILWGIYVWDG